MGARVAVLRFPGSNCENETLEAVCRAGMEGRIIRWNEPQWVLEEFAAFILPGGFSYQDRIRAGAVAARLPMLDHLTRRARAGDPILGICNGAQILAEAGLVPGPYSGEAEPVRLALAHNEIEHRNGYYTRWVFLAPGPSSGDCLFTRDLEEAVPMPMAHGEGRYVTCDPELELEMDRRATLCYAHPDGRSAHCFPWNPNGSTAGMAGVANTGGNVLALMPHPERAQVLAQVPEDLPGPWGDARRRGRRFGDLSGDGPGLVLFRALARTLALRGGKR